MKKFNEEFTEDEVIVEGLFGNIMGGIKNLAKSASDAYKAGYQQTAAATSKAEADIAQKKMPTIIQGITDKITADTKTISDSIDKSLKQDPNSYNGASKDIVIAAIISAALDAALQKLQSEALTECYTREERKAIVEGILGKVVDKVVGKGTAAAFKDQKVVWSKNDTQRIGNDLAMFLQKQSAALVAELNTAIQKDPTGMAGKKPKKEAFNLITDAINIIKTNLGKTAGVEVVQFPKLPSGAPAKTAAPAAKKKGASKAKNIEGAATADVEAKPAPGATPAPAAATGKPAATPPPPAAKPKVKEPTSSSEEAKGGENTGV
jgi:hypothetical protein